MLFITTLAAAVAAFHAIRLRGDVQALARQVQRLNEVVEAREAAGPHA